MKTQSKSLLIGCLSAFILLSFVSDIPTLGSLKGTWIYHNKYGYSMIEIRDTNDVVYTSYIDRQKQTGKKQSDRYWFYKSKARLGFWNEKTIWILTDKLRFDYKIHGDSLIEFDKMGEQGIFIKVETDDQKVYKRFNTSSINGRIDWLSSNEHFTSKKIYYQFQSIACPSSGGKRFGEVAAVGDSIYKPAQADTLILIKQTEHKQYKFPFIQFN